MTSLAVSVGEPHKPNQLEVDSFEILRGTGELAIIAHTLSVKRTGLKLRPAPRHGDAGSEPEPSAWRSASPSVTGRDPLSACRDGAAVAGDCDGPSGVRGPLPGRRL